MKILKLNVYLLCVYSGASLATESSCKVLDSKLRKTSVTNAFKRGVIPKEDFVFHGTTIGALKFFLKTGKWIPSGDIYVSINPDLKSTKDFITRLGPRPVEVNRLDHKAAFSEARGYAKDVAQEIYLSEFLNLKVENRDATPTISELLLTIEKKHGREKSLELESFLDKKVKGVVISFGPDTLKVPIYLPEKGPQDEGFRIERSDWENLALENLVGVEPIGNYEFEIFEGLIE